MNKGQVIEEAAIRFERELRASRDKVWGYLTEPRLLSGWYGESEIEPREGGKIVLMGGHIRGVVTGWRSQEFFAYTWNVFQPGESASSWPVTYLEFALGADGQNTKLSLTHRPIPKRMQPQTMMGWHTFLDMMESAARGESVAARDVHMKKNAALYGVDLNKLQR